MNIVGMSLISSVIFVAITLTAIAIVFQTAIPVVEKLQHSVVIDRMKTTFSDLDEIIRTVAAEGRGARRTIFLNIEPGKLTVNETADRVVWEFATEAEIMSCRTAQRFGNLIVGCNLETIAYEGTYNATDAYVLENERMTAYFKKIGSPTSHAAFNMSDALLALYQKDTGNWLDNAGFFDVTIDNNASSSTGTGYTELIEAGENLPYATVATFMNSSEVDYYVNFTLESGLDFLIIEASLL